MGPPGAEVRVDLFSVSEIVTAIANKVLAISRAQVVTMIVRGVESLASGMLIEPPADWKGTWSNFDPTHGPTPAQSRVQRLKGRSSRRPGPVSVTSSQPHPIDCPL